MFYKLNAVRGFADITSQLTNNDEHLREIFRNAG